VATSGEGGTIFHVEIRQFPSTVRKFNLSRAQLDASYVRPWLAGKVIEVDDVRFSPERAKFTILSGPPLRTDQIGMGRGWANAQRDGVEVTDRILSEAEPAETVAPAAATPAQAPATNAVQTFKRDLLAACQGKRVSFDEVVALTAAQHLGARASERLALAEMAVWELLHQGQIAIYADERSPDPLGRDRWQGVVLAWESWGGEGATPTVAATKNPG
jgi:hypothetical protein